MGASTPESKFQKDHFILLRQFVPKDRFYQEFDNRVRSSKTLLCFSLGQNNKVLWDFWGHTYNDPGHDHAETVALRAIKDFLKQCREETGRKYELTIYLSFSPCAGCCKRLTAFVRSESAVQVSILVSRLYFPQERDTREKLQQLVHSGIRLGVMGKKDFEKCHYLFVDYCSNFEEWPELDEESENECAILQGILQECDEESHSQSDDLASSIWLSLTPLGAGTGWTSQGLETPQKAPNVAKDTDYAQGVKRKLFDDC